MKLLLVEIDESTLELIRQEHDQNVRYPREVSTGAPQSALKLIAQATEINNAPCAVIGTPMTTGVNNGN